MLFVKYRTEPFKHIPPGKPVVFRIAFAIPVIVTGIVTVVAVRHRPPFIQIGNAVAAEFGVFFQKIAEKILIPAAQPYLKLAFTAVAPVGGSLQRFKPPFVKILYLFRRFPQKVAFKLLIGVVGVVSGRIP